MTTPTFFTAKADYKSVVADTELDPNFDPDLGPVSASVFLTPEIAAGDVILAVDASPRPTGFLPAPIRGRIDVDGRLKLRVDIDPQEFEPEQRLVYDDVESFPAVGDPSKIYKATDIGTWFMWDGEEYVDYVPVRLLADTELLRLDTRLQYRVDFKDVRFNGQPGVIRGFSFLAPNTDEVVNLIEVGRVPGITGVGVTIGPRGYRTIAEPVDPEDPDTLYRFVDETGVVVPGDPVPLSDIIPTAIATTAASIAAAAVIPGAVNADLAARSIGFVDEGSGTGHFTIGGVPISGTLVPPAALWSSLGGIPDLERPIPGAVRLYVDPDNGSDSNSGVTWDKAFATIQAAFDAAPIGGEVVLAPTNHDVGDGATVAAAKLLTVIGAKPLRRRQYAGASEDNQARLFSSAETKPEAFIDITDSGANAYGWMFKSFYIEGGDLAIGGAGIRAVSVNRAIVEDVGGRVLLGEEDTGDDERYLVKSIPSPTMSSGADASWWTLRNCLTYGMRGVWAEQANYWEFPGCSFLGVHLGGRIYRPSGPGVYLKGSQPNTNGLYVENWQDGVHLEDCRGPLVHGLASEWCDNIVRLTDCYDALVIVNSRAGSGASAVIDENGVGNTIIGTDRVTRTGQAVSDIRISQRGVTPSQLAGGYLAPVYYSHPTIPGAGRELLPHIGAMYSAGVSADGIVAEYYDGSDWQTWVIDTHPLHLADSSAVTIDADHKRCRFRMGSFVDGPLPSLLFGRIVQTAGDIGTVTVTTYTDSSHSVVGSTYTTPLGRDVSPLQVRGFLCSLPIENGYYIEVELDLGLTGAQTAQLRQLKAWGGEFSGAMRPARILEGRTAPEGVVTGRVGDFYFAHGTSGSDTTNTGIYRKLSGTGNTGWGKAVFVPATPPSVTGSKGGNAALSSLITQLAALGIITDGT